MKRPDQCHYVIDPAPDVMIIQNNETGEREYRQVIQIWCDPKYPEAWQDQRLMRFLSRRDKEGIIGIVRFGNTVNDFVLLPPSVTGDGSFHARPGSARAQFSAEEIFKHVGEDKIRLCL